MNRYSESLKKLEIAARYFCGENFPFIYEWCVDNLEELIALADANGLIKEEDKWDDTE